MDKQIEIEFSYDEDRMVIMDQDERIWEGEDMYEAFLFLTENGYL